MNNFYKRTFGLFSILSLFFLTFLSTQAQQTLFPGVTGNALIDSLRKHYKPTFVASYDVARDSMFKSFNYEAGGIECFYTGNIVKVSQSNARVEAQNAGYNTEHIWPVSKFIGRGNPYADLHHLRPTKADVNASRNNYRFKVLNPSEVTTFWREAVSQSSIPTGNLGEWSKTKKGETFDDSFFEPRDVSKGDVARAKFYFYTMYETEALAADRDYFSSQMSTLRQFHEKDPVDGMEYVKTLKIGRMQSGKENPFVLDSTLVRRAFFTNYTGPVISPTPAGRFITEYTFSGTSSCNDEDLEPNRQSPGITFSNFFRKGVNCNLVANAFNSNGWPTSYDVNTYVGFTGETLTNYKAGFSKNDTLSVVIRRSTTGPNQYRMVLAHGNSLTTLREGNLEPANSSFELKIAMPEITGLTRFEIRVYAWNSSAATGTFRISTLKLIGDVVNTNVGTRLDSDTPDKAMGFELLPAYPNPFNPTTTLRYSLQSNTYIALSLYDISGRKVRDLFQGYQTSGSHEYQLTADGLSSGIYIAKLQQGNASQSVKISLLK
jgi:endonuclease I